MTRSTSRSRLKKTTVIWAGLCLFQCYSSLESKIFKNLVYFLLHKFLCFSRALRKDGPILRPGDLSGGDWKSIEEDLKVCVVDKYVMSCHIREVDFVPKQKKKSRAYNNN